MVKSLKRKKVEAVISKKGQTTLININYLLGVLQGFKDDGKESVTLSVLNDAPLLVDEIILIAHITREQV